MIIKVPLALSTWKNGLLASQFIDYFSKLSFYHNSLFVLIINWLLLQCPNSALLKALKYAALLDLVACQPDNADPQKKEQLAR